MLDVSQMVFFFVNIKTHASGTSLVVHFVINLTKLFYFGNILQFFLLLFFGSVLVMCLSLKDHIPDIAIHLFQELFSSTGFPRGKL